MSLHDLVSIQEEREKRDRNLYRLVFSKVKNKINNYGSMGSTDCLFTVTEFIPGQPLINVGMTMDYILRKLNKEGFYTVIMPNPPNTIYISWEIGIKNQKKIKDKKKKENKRKESKISFSLEEENKKRDSELTNLLINKKLNRD